MIKKFGIRIEPAACCYDECSPYESKLSTSSLPHTSSGFATSILTPKEKVAIAKKKAFGSQKDAAVKGLTRDL